MPVEDSSQAVWQTEEFAVANLAEWGDPREPPEIWDRGKRQRLALLPKLIVGQSVLDVGCGVGHGHAMIRDSVVDYVGVDSPARIAVCRRLFPTATFVPGSIYALDGFALYDTVIAIQVLLHLPTIAEPLHALWAHARHCLVFTIWPPTDDEELHYSTAGVLGHRFTRVQILRALRALQGLTAVQACTVQSDGSVPICYVQLYKDVSGRAPIGADMIITAFEQAQ